MDIHPSTCELTGPRVCVLAYPGLCTFEFGICAEIFGLPRPELGNNWYRYQVAGTSVGNLPAAGGINISVTHGLEGLKQADLILIPGWSSPETPVPPGLSAALKSAHRQGARIASICSGIFVLAAVGLLDDCQATTHWRYADQLKDMHPEIDLVENVLYVDNGDVLTSAGSAAGIDLCLHIIRQDFGSQTANSVARRLVLPAHREGGQAQYVPTPVAASKRNSISQLQETIQQRLSDTWDVERMADISCTSPRTLLRRFKSTTGMSPKNWLLHARISRARELLETSRQSMDTIAHQVGFGSTETMRHHFRRILGTPPSHYRLAFQNQEEQLTS